jgi:hypothetical protein
MKSMNREDELRFTTQSCVSPPLLVLVLVPFFGSGKAGREGDRGGLINPRITLTEKGTKGEEVEKNNSRN